jgi:hypothetical protein
MAGSLKMARFRRPAFPQNRYSELSIIMLDREREGMLQIRRGGMMVEQRFLDVKGTGAPARVDTFKYRVQLPGLQFAHIE